MPKKLTIEKGTRFYKCVIVKEAQKIQRTSRKVRAFECQCDCGSVFVAQLSRLRNGDIKSCGCIHAPHNQSKTLTYNIWKSMRQRCFNQKNKDYPSYGALGVTVCDRWSEYLMFVIDMGICPKGMSIDRVDTKGNYNKENCRWATPIEQANNKRSTIRYDVNGINGSISELSRRFNHKPRLIYDRLRLGWSLHRALTVPITTNSTRSKYSGDHHV